jgi:hypothetical protein
MNNISSGTKYSKQLAINETSSRKQIDRLELFNDEPDPYVTELKKSLYTYNVAYSVIFDGLSLACTMFYDKQWQDKSGEWHDVISRKNDITETHYRLFAPEEFLKTIFAGYFEDEWPNIKNQLIKLSFKAEPKKLMIDKTHYIIDAPLKVTPWYETDNIEKFTNLSPRRNGKTKEEREKTKRITGKAKGKIVGFSIEFFKPLFEPLLESNQKGRAGKNYILTPPYFQLKLNSMFRGGITGVHNALEKKLSALDLIVQDALKTTNLPTNQIMLIKDEKKQIKKRAKVFEKQIKRKLERVTPLDVRKIYLALALKDNHRGDYITITNLVEFIGGIWPELIRVNASGEKTLFPAQYEEAIKKTDFILNFYFQVMARRGDMDGGQIVPFAIISEQTGEEFNRETNKLRIQCIKKDTLFSKYTVKDTAKFLLEAK